MPSKNFKNYSTTKSREETVEEIKKLFSDIGIFDPTFVYENDDPQFGVLEYGSVTPYC